MAHAAPVPPGDRRRRALMFAAVVVLVLVVIIVAVIVLNNGKTSKVTNSPAPSSPAPSTSAPGSPAPSTSAPITSAPTTAPTPTPTPTTSTPTPAKTTRKATPTPVRTVSPLTVPLIVLNNTNITGLASGAASEYQGKGWTVSSVGQFTGGIVSSVAYYDPSASINRTAALLLQQQFPGIQRVVPRFDGLPAAPIVVVLTGDYS